ncbi:hypothetical protein LEP1GSC036_1497 [Leptospira weilii str. 2006001853]|uniref:Uncharacterized protein n=1 Tax=Leptospira weilii str. 2006001853 TaxID=1001589 RepID=A0A828Z8B0_9LEPT|nr:hypothetical protein LEP1GSC036_1497 [Leptospira weilii str. 2006001853]EMJ63606.1 hypothetical protein LEP1GSC051_1210 [Leptospira sp. P2653]QDK24637.1 hypothetical protein FHG67_00915 [Leptospira weilii]QDK28594.1 hypothetical protein FHG68_00925 [Leptospira weilii]
MKLRGTFCKFFFRKDLFYVVRFTKEFSQSPFHKLRIIFKLFGSSRKKQSELTFSEPTMFNFSNKRFEL